MTGQTVYRGDMALIELFPGVTATNVIYRGGTTSSALSSVAEMWYRSPLKGDQFCTGGSASGELCNWTVDAVGIDTPVSFQGKPAGTLRNAVRGFINLTYGTKEGDSGGSVFTVRSDGQIAAKGIISAGSTVPGYGTVKPVSSVYFTDI